MIFTMNYQVVLSQKCKVWKSISVIHINRIKKILFFKGCRKSTWNNSISIHDLRSKTKTSQQTINRSQIPYGNEEYLLKPTADIILNGELWTL